MNIKEILSKETIAIGISANSKEELLVKMVDLADKSGKIPNKAQVLQSVIEREKIMSTGIGKNVGLPHAKTNSIESPIGALAILKPAMDFDALDGELINICFLLLGKENNVGVHLRLLSKISRYLNNDDFRTKLNSAETAEEVFQLFEDIED